MCVRPGWAARVEYCLVGMHTAKRGMVAACHYASLLHPHVSPRPEILLVCKGEIDIECCKVVGDGQ